MIPMSKLYRVADSDCESSNWEPGQRSHYAWHYNYNVYPLCDKAAEQNRLYKRGISQFKTSRSANHKPHVVWLVRFITNEWYVGICTVDRFPTIEVNHIRKLPNLKIRIKEDMPYRLTVIKEGVSKKEALDLQRSMVHKYRLPASKCLNKNIKRKKSSRVNQK